MTIRSNSSRRPLPRIPHQQRLSLPLPAKSAQLLRTVSLHLYRGLLREASYLYDDVSRAYITQYIRQRFRRSKEEDKPFRYMTHIKTARYGLNTLARANAGDIDRLYKVLQLGWGRIGPRRHWAWDRLMEYPTTEPLKPLVPGVPRTIPPPTKSNPALKAVLEAWTRGPMKIRRLDPTVPEETILFKPLSRRRRNNILWRNHTTLLDKTFPPITRSAFQLLEDLASGRATGVGPRRGERVIKDGMTVGIRPLPESADVHIVTGRVKRRLYEKLIKECCWLAFDPDTNSWKAGRKINGLRKKLVGWDGFFENVDAEAETEFPARKWDEKEDEWDRWIGGQPVARKRSVISKDPESEAQDYARTDEPGERSQQQQLRRDQVRQSEQQSQPQQQNQLYRTLQPQQSRQQDQTRQSEQRSRTNQTEAQTSAGKPNYNASLISRGKAAERRGKDRG